MFSERWRKCPRTCDLSAKMTHKKLISIRTRYVRWVLICDEGLMTLIYMTSSVTSWNIYPPCTFFFAIILHILYRTGTNIFYMTHISKGVILFISNWYFFQFLTEKRKMKILYNVRVKFTAFIKRLHLRVIIKEPANAGRLIDTIHW